jgi:heme/copper-type cytochrome/quinol oxidase subunit 4
MAGPLTHAAVLLLARDRIAEVRDTLQARRAAGHTLHPVEERIRELADRAYAMLGEGTPPPEGSLPVRPLGTTVGAGISRFALMGSMGPALPAFSSLLTPYQDWAARLVHSGNADPDRERVVAGSTDFALRFWTESRREIAEIPVGERDAATKNARAFVLGWMSHVAADVVTAPFLDGYRWGVSPKSRLRFAEDGRAALAAEVHLDALVARQVFRRGSTRSGVRWSEWYPPTDEVKDHFFAAYQATLERLYRAETGPPQGFGGFEDRYDAYPRPAVSAEFLKSGYRTYRDWALPLGYDHTFWSFWVWMTGVFFAVPLLAVPPFVLALGEGRKQLLPRDPDHDSEQAWYELLSLPLMLSSWVPPVAGLALFNPLTTHEGGTYFWLSFALSIGSTALSATAFGLAVDGMEVKPWVRWGILFGIPVALLVVHLVFFFRDLGPNERRAHRLLPFLFLVPLFVLALSLALHLVLHRLFAEEAADADDLTDPAPFWLTYAAWLVIGIVLWAVAAHWLRDWIVPEYPGDHASLRPRTVRLFDDATLHRLPDPRDGRFFPAGRRRLLKLWWEGSGDLWVRSDRTHLLFSRSSGGENPLVVPAPLSPMTVEEFGEFLRRRLVVDGVAGKLRWAHADARDRPLDYELPPGATFADAGDEDGVGPADHDEKAKKWTKLAGSADDSDFYLYHAPKPVQSVFWGPGGPVSPERFRSSEAAGPAGSSVEVPAADLREVVGAGTAFLGFFRPGDVVQVGDHRRAVQEVVDDGRLRVALPFPAAVAAGTAYRRLAQDRFGDVEGPGLVEGLSDGGGFTLRGLRGTRFGETFIPGDRIRVHDGDFHQVRTVHSILSDELLSVDPPFRPAVSSPVVGGSGYERLGAEDAMGYPFAPGSPDGELPEDSLMAHAADLAALLCMGAATHLQEPAPDPRDQVWQVFRNWNLDRRRVNEWQMLVAGGAVSEKEFGHPERRDPAMPEGAPDTRTPAGEATATRHGWVPVMRKWLEMHRRGEEQLKTGAARRPGDPTNHQLTEAMGFLLNLDVPAGVP